MTTVQLHRDASQQLVSSRRPVEVRNDAGRRIGYFLPTADDDPGLWERARQAFTDEEIDRARADREGGLTTEELLQALEARWPSK